MTDLELTKACAVAMGQAVYSDERGLCWLSRIEVKNFANDNKRYSYSVRYDPLHDDAQAMALVKLLKLDCTFGRGDLWYVDGGHEEGIVCHDSDLNRAICECVAKMKAAP